MRIICWLILFMVSNSILAKTCLERLKNVHWPKDDHLFVLDCKLDEIKVGDRSLIFGDGLCFGITKTHNSRFQRSLYSSLRYTDLSTTLDVVYPSEQGKTAPSDRLFVNDKLIRISKKRPGMHRRSRYIYETTLNKSTGVLTYNSYKQRLIGKKLLSSASYLCESEPL